MARPTASAGPAPRPSGDRPPAERTAADRTAAGSVRPIDVAVVVLLTAATRIAWMPDGIVGKDASHYFNALNFDRSFDVPPPGHIGYVVLGKAATLLWSDHVTAFAAVATLLSCIGAAYVLLLASLLLPRATALLVTAATMLSTLTWYHGVPVMSYIVWLTFPPMIAWYGVRYLREQRAAMLIAAAIATGVSTIIRPDMVAFAGPLLGGFLVLGRASLRLWVAAAAICAASCCVWFFGTAAVLGGVDTYLEVCRAKHQYHEGFGPAEAGLFEGLGRNGAKYVVMLLWTGTIALPFAALGALRDLLALRTTWKGWILAALWVGPSLYFSLIVFMGNAGLLLPLIPLLYFAAARGLEWIAPASNPRRFILAGLAAIACANAAQFALTPIPRPTDQRIVILTVTFFRYTGAGIRHEYDYNLTDFNIGTSLSNVLKQMKDPEPVPLIPADYRAPR